MENGHEIDVILKLNNGGELFYHVKQYFYTLWSYLMMVFDKILFMKIISADKEQTKQKKLIYLFK